MKRFVVVFVTLFALCLSAMSAFAQIKEVPLPKALDVRHIVAISDILFVGTWTDGLWRRDGRGRWSQVLKRPIHHMVQMGGAIFVASNGRMYRSTDKGNDWWPIPAGIDSADVDMIAVEKDARELFAHGVSTYYVSTDSGEQWSKLLIEGYGYTLAAYNNNLFMGGGEGGNYRSLNGLELLPAMAGTDEPIWDWGFTDRYVFAVNDSGVFRSSDHGATCERLLGGVYAEHVEVVNDNEIFVGTYQGVYRLTNGVWRKIEGFDKYVWSMTVGEDGVYVGTNGNLYFIPLK